MRANDISGRIYHCKRRPRGDSVAPPHPELPVIDDGMDSVEAQRSVGYPGSDSFSVILAAVNSDYDKLRGIFRFQLPQLREYVKTVDSPIGPEIQKDDLAAQVGKPELFSAGMDPVEIVGELGCSHSRFGGKLSRHRLKSSIFGRQDCTNYATM